jgi:chemotaxis protein CheC
MQELRSKKNKKVFDGGATLVTEKTQSVFSLANWTKLAKVGSNAAVSGLSQMVNQNFSITALSIEEVSMRNAYSLLGKPEDTVIGIYSIFRGKANGQILLAFQPSTAFELVDMVMGADLGTTANLGEMERSVLGEMGDIVGTFFLNGVADSVGLRLMPSPPAVVEDLAGALIGSILAEAFDANESLFVIKLMFTSDTKEIEGRFLVLPSIDLKNL